MKVWDKKLAREIEIDPAGAQAGIAQGLYVPQNDTHYIVDQYGHVGESDAAELPGWFAKGQAFASDEDIGRYKAQNSPGTAFALGAGDMASFGGLNAATQAFEGMGMLPEGTSASAKYYREENTGAHIAGQLLPAVMSLPAAAIRGTGAAAMALRAATAAPRAVTRAATRVGRTTADAVRAKGLGPGLPSQAARMGAEGATEGVLHGFAQGLNEADFGDPAQVAEKLLASAAVGALTGGLVGAGAIAPLGAAFRAGSTKVSKGLSTLFENSTGEPALKKMGAKAEEFLRAQQKKFNPGKEKFIDEMASERALLGNDELIPQTTTKMADAINRTETIFDDVLREGLVGAKTRNVAKQIVTENAGISVGWGQRIINDMEALGDALGTAHGKKLVRLADEARFSSHGGDPAKTFAAVDTLKREIDNLIDWDNIRKRQAAGMQGMAPGLEETEQLLIRANKSLRSGLEDARLWGDKAASLQAQTNKVLSKLRQEGGDWRTKFMARTKGGAKYVADPTKIGSFLRDMTGPRNDLRAGILRDRLSDQRVMAKLLRESYDLPPPLAKKLAELESATAELDAGFQTASKQISFQNQVKSMAQGSQSGPIASIATSRLNQAIGGLAAGGVAGMIATRAVGEGISAIANPARYYLNAAKTMQSATAVSSHIKARVGDFVTATKTKLGPAVKKVAVGAPMVQRGARAPLMVALTKGDTASRNVAYQEVHRTLELVAQNPDTTNDSILRTMGPMQDMAPGIGQAMSSKLVANSQWLLDHLPATREWPTMFGREPQLSDMELQQAQQMLAISEDPLRAVDLLAQGRLTITDVQAYKGMWPSLYEETRASILESLEEPAVREKMGYSKRIQLGILFEMPTDPTLMPEQVMLAQAANKKITSPAEEEEGGGGEFSSKAIEGVAKEGTTMDQSALREG